MRCRPRGAFGDKTVRAPPAVVLVGSVGGKPTFFAVKAGRRSIKALALALSMAPCIVSQAPRVINTRRHAAAARSRRRHRMAACRAQAAAASAAQHAPLHGSSARLVVTPRSGSTRLRSWRHGTPATAASFWGRRPPSGSSTRPAGGKRRHRPTRLPRRGARGSGLRCSRASPLPPRRPCTAPPRRCRPLPPRRRRSTWTRTLCPQAP